MLIARALVEARSTGAGVGYIHVVVGVVGVDSDIGVD
jgi:hypothetical protein